jgi:hypothetical protein
VLQSGCHIAALHLVTMLKVGHYLIQLHCDSSFRLVSPSWVAKVSMVLQLPVLDSCSLLNAWLQCYATSERTAQQGSITQ